MSSANGPSTAHHSPVGVSGPAAHPAPALPFELVRRGKVRDVYRLPGLSASGESRLLMVASDRISAFDVVMRTPITGKGRLLTDIAAWWFKFIEQRRICQTHVLSTRLDDLEPDLLARLSAAQRDFLNGRVTICRACEVIPVECVVRGYLEGGGWKEYRESGSVSGVRLPAGLRQCDKLPESIFTPATKAAVGHDENISFDHAADLIGLETAGVIRDLSLAIYKAAAAHALARGIIIADTKFEFGVPLDDLARQGRAWVQPVLIDEALTPDSSRFWPADGYAPGRPQKSFDKQFLREYLEELVAAGKWNKTPGPDGLGPDLPERVVLGTLERYQAAKDALCAE